MALKRIRVLDPEAVKADETRRRHRDALVRGHPNHIAVLIANGQLPENHPLAETENIETFAVGEEKAAAPEIEPAREQVQEAPCAPALADEPKPIIVDAKDVNIPREYIALPWKEMQALASRIAGARIASRTQAISVIEKELAGRKA